MPNQKNDNQLNLALDISEAEREKSSELSTGFNPLTRTWELIVKYNGDLTALQEDIIKFEPLTNKYAILIVEEDKVDKIASYPQIEFVEKPKQIIFQLDISKRAACITPVQDIDPKLSGKGVLIGIIDSGIDYRHPDFINPDGTSRIVSILQINDLTNLAESAVEYTTDEINEAINAPTFDEALKIVPSTDVIGHGTHVAGIAGGNGRASNGQYRGVAYESEFIIVQLGATTNQPFVKTTEIMRGIIYILNKARSLGKPVAINISYGNNYGSHDGNSLFETYIDEMSNTWKNVIAVGSGNEGAAGHHYHSELEEGEQEVIEFDVSPSERSVSIQFWKSYADDISIEIVAPNGQSSGFIKPVLGTQQFSLLNTKIALFFGKPSPFDSDQEIYFQLIPDDDYITVGTWKINVKADKIVVGDIDLWLPTSSGLNIFTKFLTPSTDTTLTVPSTAAKVITVGGYDQVNNSIASFSGRGYLRELDLVKPNLVAPAVNIMSTVPGGGYDSLSGTSMATPFVTGSAALLMQWGIVENNDPFLYGEKVKAYLQSSAKRDTSVREYPNNVWGYGALCLANVFNDSLIATVNVAEQGNLIYKEELNNENNTINNEVLDNDIIRKTNSQADTWVKNGANNSINNNQVSEATPYTFGPECETAIISNDYMDLIIEYTDTVEDAVKQYNPACVQVLNDQYAIIHIRAENCSERINEEGYGYRSLFPKLIAPYAKAELSEAGILPFHTQPYVPLRGENVLIGIVDTGIDYTHPVFIYEDNTTKILSIWDQSIQGAPPDGFAYGTEYTQEQINEALKSENPYEIVPTVDTDGHGTFLAGTAAGREDAGADFIGAAPDSELIVVKLKEAKQCLLDYYMANNAGIPVYQSNDLMMGVKYLTEQANRLNRPISIIVGLGSNAGAHDGSSMTSIYMLQVAKRMGRVVTIAGGNEGNTGHHHYTLFGKNQPSADVEINVAKDEEGFIVDIWGNAPDKISIAITSPTGEYIAKMPVRLNQSQKTKLVLEKTTVYIEYEMFEERTGDEHIIVRLEQPTEGIWTITLFGDLIVDGRVDLWLPRRNFIKPETVFLIPDPFITITYPAATIAVITTGAYNSQTGGLYLGSSRGLTRDLELKPDLVAPGVNVIGPLPNKQFGVMTGTGVAAAITGGASALLLEWGIIKGNDTEMDTQKVMNYLIAGARRNPNIDYPNREWGYGELNLIGTFESLKGYKS